MLRDSAYVSAMRRCLSAHQSRSDFDLLCNRAQQWQLQRMSVSVCHYLSTEARAAGAPSFQCVTCQPTTASCLLCIAWLDSHFADA